MTRYHAGLDVGGSAIKAGVVDDDGKPLSSLSLPTEAARGPAFGLERMCEAVRAATATAKLSLADLASVGVAVPGLMDIHAGIITDSVNMPGWKDVPVKAHLVRAFGLPTAFQNDANAAALGECWVGAGRGLSSLVFFTLGTGVGGGIVMGGKVLEGRNSCGGELGHVRIELTNPRLCGCGRRGCLEAYASALSIVKRVQEAEEASPLKGIAGLEAKHVFDAWAKGDALATRIVEETAFYLGVAVANTMHTLDPEMVVFGGGMIAAGEGFLALIRKNVKELAFPLPAARTPVEYATLGEAAGFIGAAACGRQLVRP